jgi:hypothetical protein
MKAIQERPSKDTMIVSFGGLFFKWVSKSGLSKDNKKGSGKIETHRDISLLLLFLSTMNYTLCTMRHALCAMRSALPIILDFHGQVY